MEIKNVFLIKNFRLVFFGALVSELGAVMYNFAVSFYILQISGNNALVQGLYLGICGIFYVLFNPIGGVIGDRYNKAKIMYLCDYAKGAAILLTALLLSAFGNSMTQIIVLMIGGAIGNAVGGLFSPASGSLFPEIMDEDQLQQANSYVSVKNAAQSILGVILAGVLYAALPTTLLFAIVGCCYLLSGVSEMFIRIEHTSPSEKLTMKIALDDMKEGVQYLFAQKAILALMAAILFFNFFSNPVYSNFIPFFIRTDVAGAPSYLFDRFLAPELWSSVFSMLGGISMLIGAVILSTRKAKEKFGRFTAVCAIGVSLVMLAGTLGYYFLVSSGRSLNSFLLLFGALLFANGIIVSFINIVIGTAFMRMVDSNKLSKVMSILDIISQGMVPLASMLSGIILQYGGSLTLLVITTTGFTITAFFLLTNKHIKTL